MDSRAHLLALVDLRSLSVIKMEFACASTIERSFVFSPVVAENKKERLIT